jgi:hypothetical protein
MTLSDFLAVLTDVKTRAGGRYMARCPAHEDSSPSLSVQAGEQAILLRCFAACTPLEIVSSLKLTMSDLFFGTPTKQAVRKAHAEQFRKRRVQQQREYKIALAREAMYEVMESEGISLDSLSDYSLDYRLNRLATCYAILDRDEYTGDI